MKVRTIWITLVAFLLLILAIFTFNAHSKMRYSRGISGSNYYLIDGKRFYVDWDSILQKPPVFNYSERFKPNSVIVQHPSKENNWRTIKYHINSYGFRDKEYNYTKPNGTFRIVLLGDSYVFGASVEDNETFDYFFEKEANRYRKIESLNLGVWGYDTPMEVGRLKNLGLKFHPDMVMLFYFQNDFQDTIVSDKMQYYFTKALMKKNYSGEEALSIYKEIIKEYYFTTPLGKPFNKAFEIVSNGLGELYNLSNVYNFTVVLFAFPSPSNQIDRLKAIADDYNWTFINLKDIGYEYEKPWILNKYDKHPSVYAHRKIADFLIKFLRKEGII